MDQLYQDFIALRTYSRYRDDLGRRETWPESVGRWVEWWCEKYPDHEKWFRETAQPAIENKEVMPSMRSLQTAGKALDRDHCAGYNCSYTPIDDPRCFDEIMYILLCGTGVGFSVERQYVSKLPEIPEEFHDVDTEITVPDNKRGWANSLRQLISLLYSGAIPRWNMEKVRPSGARLKTFGGRASGPQPLRELFNFTVEMFKNAAGRKLSSLECHDLVCKIGDVVVVGGVRRSALISLSNLSDDRMRMAKCGQWWVDNPQRALANNSACYAEKPEFEVFLKEWESLYESKSGERGIFSRKACEKQVARNGRRDGGYDFGTNPCLHPDSMVETIHGRMKIGEITEPTMVYSMDSNGKLCIRPCSPSWISKENAETIRVQIASGKEVVCTPDHKIYAVGRGWIEAQNLHIGDKVIHLVRNRRGSSYSGVKLTTQGRRDFSMEHVMVWEAYHGPLPEGYDVHHIDGDTYNNDIDNLEALSHSDHARLTALEQPNNHMVTGYNGKGKTGYGFISPATSRHGRKVIVPMPEELKSNLHQYATITGVEEGPKTDVYDLYVEETHNFISDFVVVHNCSEIILRPRGFCNLTECVIRPSDSYDEIRRKVEIATILGTFQSSLTDFRYLRKEWKKNAEEERLLGVSLTGIMDNPVLYNIDGNEYYEVMGRLIDLQNESIKTNKKWASKLDINPSASITCVKPSGTVSQLCNTSSGIHPRFSDYYLRSVRADKKDPLAQFMIDKGFPWEDDIHNKDNYIFYFPIKSPDNSVTADNMSAMEQLKIWEVYQEHWCEHKPSMTCYYDDSEFLEIGSWVWNNFDKISGISFLPRMEHIYEQAPFIKIDKKEYEDYLKKMPKEIDWTELEIYEGDDFTEGGQILACHGGSCEL